LISSTLSCKGGSSGDSKEMEVSVSSVSLNKSTIDLTIGETSQLYATVSPNTASNATVSWSSSNSNVASVKEGLITAISEGTVIITAKAGSKSATCTVTVSKVYVKVSDINVNIEDVSLTPGDTTQIKVTINPSDATDQNVTYTSSDESVVTVSSDGVITAVGGGVATITVTVDGVSKTIKVTVVVHVNSIEISPSGEVNLHLGKSIQLGIIVSPLDATLDGLQWSTSDSSVAIVSEEGVLKGVKIGTATITVTVDNQSASIIVNVSSDGASGSHEGASIEDWN